MLGDCRARHLALVCHSSLRTQVGAVLWLSRDVKKFDLLGADFITFFILLSLMSLREFIDGDQGRGVKKLIKPTITTFP